MILVQKGSSSCQQVLTGKQVIETWSTFPRLFQLPIVSRCIQDLSRIYPEVFQKYSKSIPDVPMVGNVDNGFVVMQLHAMFSLSSERC